MFNKIYSQSQLLRKWKLISATYVSGKYLISFPFNNQFILMKTTKHFISCGVKKHDIHFSYCSLIIINLCNRL